MDLSAENILEKITFSVKPVEYAGESSKKELKWSLKFRNTENYKVRFELYDKDDHEEISPLLWLHKKRRNYVIIVSIILTILSITALISGILYFGGK